MIPEHCIYHLKQREGVVNRVYLDSLDNPTGGVGHLLSADECRQYQVGDLLEDATVEQWLREDSETAWLAAYNQAHGLNCPEHEQALQEALLHVNFQLGAGWPLIHKRTWAYIRDHEWQKAAIEAADSRWNDQTPLRVLDFQIALLEIARS